ncbi:MAG: efflux RND transporter periplasmic adaptor subunit [Alsobacter sp.]
MSPRSSLVMIGVIAAAGALAYQYGPTYWPQIKPRVEAVTGPLPAMPWEPKGQQAKADEAGKPGGRPPGGGAEGGAPRGQGAGQGGPRIAAVAVGKAERRPMPVRFDTIGTVQPIATVTVRTRVESQILRVAFDDGAVVKEGDVLFELDSRGIVAQIKQAEANLARSRAQLEQAQRDVKRYELLNASDVGSKVTLDNSRTTVLTVQAQIHADEAALEALTVQLSYYTIRAPISGRVGIAGIKAGNIAKTGDGSVPLAVINQISPIYVAFNVPQRLLPELREALAKGTSKVQATPQGLTDAVDGKVAVIDNNVDGTSGTITLRGIFENPDEVLWPGQLCDVRLVIRTEPEAITVPREAVQQSQNGLIVFVVEDGQARVRPVTVDRSLRGLSVVKTGLQGNETVVTDGQLLLTDGTKVETRAAAQPRPAGGGQRPAGKAPADGQTSGATPPAASPAPAGAAIPSQQPRG